MQTDQIDEPVLVVRAECTDRGISVTWTNLADGDRLDLSVHRLVSMLGWIADRPVIMRGKPFDAVPGMPDAVGSLLIEVDDVVRVEKGFVEPSATQRGNGSSIGFDTIESQLPTVRRLEFGPQTRSGPPTTWSNLADAILHDVDGHE